MKSIMSGLKVDFSGCPRSTIRYGGEREGETWIAFGDEITFMVPLSRALNVPPEARKPPTDSPLWSLCWVRKESCGDDCWHVAYFRGRDGYGRPLAGSTKSGTAPSLTWDHVRFDDPYEVSI